MSDLTSRQKEALIMGQSIFVTAGAGTGKTFLLSKRYLSLLEDLGEQKGVEIVSKILALTFTEKSASEMRERIELDIRMHAVSATKKDECQFWTNILDRFFHSSITTFHGFCASVLREFALDAGLNPGFRILDEVEKQVMTATIIRNVFIHPPKSLYFDCELLYADVSSPENVVAELLPRYLEFKHYFPKTDVEMSSYIQVWKSLMIDSIRERQMVFFSGDISSTIKELIYLSECYGMGNDSGAKYLCQILPALKKLSSSVDAKTFFSAVLSIRKVNGGKTGKRLGSRGVFGADLDRLRGSFSLLKSAIESIPKSWDRIPDEDDPFSQESIRVIAALGRVTGEVHRRYLKEKWKQGALDFDDLVRMTSDVIEVPHVLQELQRRFSHVLVDEMQDTDPVQAAIVLKIFGNIISSSNTVFLVGDPKQSIYAFRNADVCEVNAMQEKMTSWCGAHSVILDINFRSTKEILGVVNSLFSRLFTETSEAWDVPYDPLSVSSSREKDVGTVQILKVISNDHTSDMFLEAQAIADRIKELITSGIVIRDKSIMRPARFGDIAILLETRSSQAMIEYALREVNIPYSVYKSHGFYRLQEIIDITHLLSVVSGVGDDIELYGVLRSPYFGISDAELCIVGEGRYCDRVNRYAFENPSSKIASAVSMMEKWRNYAETESLQGILRRILRESGVYAVYGGIQNGRYILSNLEKLIELARSQMRRCAMSLTEFVWMLKTSIDQEIKESVAQIDPLGLDAVQILTVHASKGLEFPIVILANLNSNTSPCGTGLVLDNNFGVGLSIRIGGAGDLAVDTFVKMFTYEIRSAKEIAEKKRLFYVAMTRARDYLILSYVEGKNFPQKNSRAAWLAAYLLPKESPSSSFTFLTDDGLPVEITVIKYG